MSGCIPNAALTYIGAARGRIMQTPEGESAGIFRLPTDAIGVATVMFLDVAANSEIRVYLADMTELAGIESCVADQVLVWNVYASGSENNTVRIVIVHPSYRIKEFNYLSQTGTQSIPVQQEPDKWYSNPA